MEVGKKEDREWREAKRLCHRENFKEESNDKIRELRKERKREIKIESKNKRRGNSKIKEGEKNTE